MPGNYFVYIITNKLRTTLYIGVTNDLPTRLKQHQENSGNPKSFAGRYNCFYLIYYERFTSPTHAIEREKEIKKWSRTKKETLINTFNPKWQFLNDEIQD
jgi:putative endonuclease